MTPVDMLPPPWDELAEKERREEDEDAIAARIAAWMMLRATWFVSGLSAPDAVRYVADAIRAGEWRK